MRESQFGGHYDTAAALANAGFVVVAVDHPGGNARRARYWQVP
jgi:predicted dienelactone hydrolase